MVKVAWVCRKCGKEGSMAVKPSNILMGLRQARCTCGSRDLDGRPPKCYRLGDAGNGNAVV